MNIVELSQNEVSVISGGGLSAAEAGSFIGGLFGSVAAAIFFASEGAKHKFDDFGKLGLRSKVMTVATVALGVANIHKALIIMGCVATSNIFFSALGHVIFEK
jgi:hypothetical protein